MLKSKQCILFFIRAPEKGCVKTRLAKILGEDAALSLYRSFVLDTLDMLTRTHYPIIVCGHPGGQIQEIEAWLGRHLIYHSQTGNSLGDKMANAFSRVFREGYEKAVLIGSDIPDLPDRIIKQAFQALNDEGAALGPSLDGGYYLVAFRASAFLPQVFGDIPWGTEKVLDQTLTVFRSYNAPVSLLEPWRDIDTAEDLKTLLGKYPSNSATASRTLGYLRSETYKNTQLA